MLSRPHPRLVPRGRAARWPHRAPHLRRPGRGPSQAPPPHRCSSHAPSVAPRRCAPTPAAPQRCRHLTLPGMGCGGAHQPVLLTPPRVLPPSPLRAPGAALPPSCAPPPAPPQRCLPAALAVAPSSCTRPLPHRRPSGGPGRCKRFLLPSNSGGQTFSKRGIVEDDLCRAFKHASTACQCAAPQEVFALPWHYRGDTVAIPWHPIVMRRASSGAENL